MHLVEARARCIDCGWETEAKNAMGTAARHHQKTGHYVQVELGFVQVFGEPNEKFMSNSRREYDYALERDSIKKRTN